MTRKQLTLSTTHWHPARACQCTVIHCSAKHERHVGLYAPSRFPIVIRRLREHTLRHLTLVCTLPLANEVDALLELRPRLVVGHHLRAELEVTLSLRHRRRAARSAHSLMKYNSSARIGFADTPTQARRACAGTRRTWWGRGRQTRNAPTTWHESTDKDMHSRRHSASAACSTHRVVVLQLDRAKGAAIQRLAVVWLDLQRGRGVVDTLYDTHHEAARGVSEGIASVSECEGAMAAPEMSEMSVRAQRKVCAWR